MQSVAQMFAMRDIKAECLLDKLRLCSGDIVYVSGSVVEGLGDASSDFDLFVLTSDDRVRTQRELFASERRVLQERHEFGISYFDLEGVEFDAEYHPRSKFEELFESLRTLKPSRKTLWESFHALGRFDRSYALELLHRFRVGKPLGDPSAFLELRRDFDEEAFIRWNVFYFLMNCEDFAKGVRRSLREADLESGLLKLRCFYDALVDASLFDSGISLDRWKWRLPKLRMLGNDLLLQNYLSVQFRDPQDSAAFVQRMLDEGLRCHSRMLARYE